MQIDPQEEWRLLVGGDDIRIGTPNVAGATVTATVKDHVKGDKIIVFKMRRRKNYRRKQGHRQAYTRVKIIGIKS
jgi:large subunit ribosomal protein L21